MTNRATTDPRIDPRIKALFAGAPPATVLPEVADRETLLAMARAGAGLIQTPGFPAEPFEALVPSAGLTVETRAIPSQPGGNSINLLIVTPQGPGPFACVYYIHGGGMMMGSCFDANFAAWARMIAHQGAVAVLVDFRNCLHPSSVAEVAPFPAGLDDCVSGLRWVHDHAAELAIDPARIVVGGESGGGNLALATALRLNRDGDVAKLAGIYVMCPYLAGEWPGGPGTSADENAGILMDARSGYGAVAYGIDELHKRNPLAWPGFASTADVAGFPPTVVAVNECDPLRDDGVAFYRLLLRANVPARCRVVMGTVHATEVYILPCPEISRDAARDIVALAKGG